jgi:predicted RND superfamily exporter protein
VILGVVASMLACGWKVGMVEALCLIIVSGLSVDPVLHIASAFSQASPRLRPVARAQLAVERMGPPLLASAVTTLASAVCLSTCQLTLLSKIGLFMIFSTIWSLGTSVTLLPALLATFGPAPCGCSCTCSCSSSPVFLVTMRRHRVRGAVPLEHEDSITCQL